MEGPESWRPARGLTGRTILLRARLDEGDVGDVGDVGDDIESLFPLDLMAPETSNFASPNSRYNVPKRESPCPPSTTKRGI